MNRCHGETRAQQRSATSLEGYVRARGRNDSEHKAISREVTFWDETMLGSAIFADFVRNGELKFEYIPVP